MQARLSEQHLLDDRIRQYQSLTQQATRLLRSPGGIPLARTFVLEPCGEGVELDTRLVELSQDCFAITPIGRQDSVYLAVIGKCLQGALGHCVNGKRSGQRLDVNDVGCLGIFGSRALGVHTLLELEYHHHVVRSGGFLDLEVLRTVVERAA